MLTHTALDLKGMALYIQATSIMTGALTSSHVIVFMRVLMLPLQVCGASTDAWHQYIQ
jgi:hypothetical protein